MSTMVRAMDEIHGMSISVAGEDVGAQPLCMSKFFNDDEWDEAYEYYRCLCDEQNWDLVTIGLLAHDEEYEVLEDLILYQRRKLSSWGTIGLNEEG